MLDRACACLLIALCIWLAGSSGADAHKLKVFAAAEGATISGYAYFSPGGRAREADVTVTAPDGTTVLRTGVDDEGNFHFVAKERIDYTITVDGGDGHVANYTVRAIDLPEGLPALGATAAQLDVPKRAEGEPGATVAEAALDAAPIQQPASPGLSEAALRAAIDESVARQIRPLREQIDAFQEKVMWHDVLGGIGYIIGLGGLAYGFASRRSGADRVPAQPAQPRRPVTAA